MSMFDGLLGQLGSAPDIVNMAAKVGITPEQAEAAVAALGHAHTQAGDTVETASANTGLPTDILQQIVGHIGGEGALSQFASLIGESGGAGGIGGMIGGLGSMFDKK